MKKKFKDVKIGSDPLNPTVIGEINNKQKSPLGLFIMIIIFIVVVIFLPNISDFVANIISPNPVVNNTGSNTNKKDEDSSTSKEDTFYVLSTGLEVTVDDNFKISNIILNDESISYDVTNLTNTFLNLKEDNYYIELYNESKTLLGRIKLDEDTITKESSNSYEKVLSSDILSSLYQIVVVNKSLSDYPQVSLNTDENDNQLLTCKSKSNEIVYTFKSNKLKRIVDTSTYYVTDADYEVNKTSATALSNTYNKVDGVTSTVVENATSFVITSTISLTEAKVSTLDNIYYYDLDTLAKVVSFELEAQGYSCN